MFGPDVDTAARAHAAAELPREACGIVAGGAYVPLVNEAEEPADHFRLPADTFVRYKVQAVIHSHCADRHPPWPSAADMRSQIETAVPWGIVWAGPDDVAGPLWFGDHVVDEPLIGRDFQPGIRDCYSLLRAFYWQDLKVKLPEFPRDPDWWRHGDDLLRGGYRKAGFRLLAADEPEQRGDMVFMEIRAPVPNHCGVVLEDGLILHHLGNRLSRREPIGPWRRFITQAFRHASQE